MHLTANSFPLMRETCLILRFVAAGDAGVSRLVSHAGPSAFLAATGRVTNIKNVAKNDVNEGDGPFRRSVTHKSH